MYREVGAGGLVSKGRGMLRFFFFFEGGGGSWKLGCGWAVNQVEEEEEDDVVISCCNGDE